MSPVIFEVFNKQTEELVGTYELNPEKGSFLMTLAPNTYELSIDIPGKGYFSQPLIVLGRNKYRKEINYNITVSFENPAYF